MNECVCLEFVPAGVSCLCHYDAMLPIGPDNLTHTHEAMSDSQVHTHMHVGIRIQSNGSLCYSIGFALEPLCIDEVRCVRLDGVCGVQECKEAGVISMVDKIIKTGFASIRLIYFFTAGSDEVKCWQIRKGSKAPQAAGTIHTDFERGFICAEVMTYEDLHAAGDENAVKAVGKYRQQGKEYVVQDGDIIHFRFNVTAKGK